MLQVESNNYGSIAATKCDMCLCLTDTEIEKPFTGNDFYSVVLEVTGPTLPGENFTIEGDLITVEDAWSMLNTTIADGTTQFSAFFAFNFWILATYGPEEWTVVPDSGTSTVTITANNAGSSYNQSWDFTNIPNIGVQSETLASDRELQDNYQIHIQGKIDGLNTDKLQILPYRDCDVFEILTDQSLSPQYEMCVNVRCLFEPHLSSPLPDQSTNASFISIPPEILQGYSAPICLQAWSTYDDPITGEEVQTDTIDIPIGIGTSSYCHCEDCVPNLENLEENQRFLMTRDLNFEVGVCDDTLLDLYLIMLEGTTYELVVDFVGAGIQVPLSSVITESGVYRYPLRIDLILEGGRFGMFMRDSITGEIYDRIDFFKMSDRKCCVSTNFTFLNCYGVWEPLVANQKIRDEANFSKTTTRPCVNCGDEDNGVVNYTSDFTNEEVYTLTIPYSRKNEKFVKGFLSSEEVYKTDGGVVERVYIRDGSYTLTQNRSSIILEFSYVTKYLPTSHISR